MKRLHIVKTDPHAEGLFEFKMSLFIEFTIDGGLKVMEVDHQKIQQAVRMILEAIGEDPSREGLVDTPLRVSKMCQEIFSGLHQDPAEIFTAIFSEKHEELVLVKEIPFYSLCEHHLIPFFGQVHIAYLPRQGRVVGLSKLARAVEVVTRRPQLQERITSVLADTMIEKLDPLGVMVVVEAEHLCMSMRGVNKPGATTVTTAARGKYAEDREARAEILQLIKK